MTGIAIALFFMNLVAYDFIDMNMDRSNCDVDEYSNECVQPKVVAKLEILD